MKPAPGRRQSSADRRALLGVGVAVDDGDVQWKADLGVAEQESPRLVAGLVDGRGHRHGVADRAVHDDLVVLEEYELRGRAGERRTEPGEQDQRPLGGRALDDEVAGEPAARPGPGAALLVAARDERDRRRRTGTAE